MISLSITNNVMNAQFLHILNLMKKLKPVKIFVEMVALFLETFMVTVMMEIKKTVMVVLLNAKLRKTLNVLVVMQVNQINVRTQKFFLLKYMSPNLKETGSTLNSIRK